MLFTILLWVAPAVAILGWVIYVVREKRNYAYVGAGDVFAGFGIGIFAGFITFAVGLLGLLIASTVIPTTVMSETQEIHQLQALSTGTDTDGRFYLMGGSIDEEPAFSYIREEGDAFVLRSVDADQSYVYQGDHKPHLVVTTYERGIPVLFPAPLATTQSFQFYVPDGSVANTFEVTP